MELKLADKYRKIFPLLNEKQRRLVAASDAEFIGRGGIVKVSQASGMSRSTISIGMKELQSGSIADALQSKGHKISHNAVRMILKRQGYSLQANRKTHEGGDHPDRDGQFEFINNQTKSYLNNGQPVISVDCKKKELIGNYKNSGKEWEVKKEPVEVNVYDFMDKELGKTVPYGIYDLYKNEGWVNVGISRDTAKFAVSSIRTWWEQMGSQCYPNVKEIMITTDGGGSNSSRSRLWKMEIQKFSNETGMQVRVCHFPPGTSKWNKIEHRMFSFISMNWRGKPLVSLQAIVNLIGATKSSSGLKIKASIDENIYEKGLKVSDEEFHKINIEKDGFHGEWNYVIKPSDE